MSARRRDTARKGIAAVLVALSVPAAPAIAGGPELILPLVAAVSLGRSAAIYAGGAGGSSGPGLVSRLLPSQLKIPTMQPDPVELLETPRYASGIDTDRVVGLDLLGRRRRGWMLSLHVDDESRVPLPGGSNAVSVVAEFEF